ncbi:hypothetical protein [Diplocloster agilis]|uniref:hypothetical protein n=1 Tax=Diplocloster agilis TaxID=2850323 RepID=UPI0008221798|nr:hypothetical protein [Suonthocola fibrivorans]MCU6734910.1 hypothetical protein [Suonthocola fibrivorans]SCJ58731.1 Uncharacterised protein [uncultured Clostridium sp.]
MEKTIFRPSELIAMGYGRWELMCDCRSEGQTFATQTPGGHWRIDLPKYKAFRLKRTRVRRRAV